MGASKGKISRFVQALLDGAPTQFKGEVLGREVDYTIFNGGLNGDDPEHMTPARMWKSQPQLRTVVDFQARTISQLSLKLYTRNGEDDVERVRAGNLAEIIRRPNTEQTMTELIYELVGDWALYDNAYVMVTPTPDGSFALQVIPASWVSPVMATTFTVKHYNIQNVDGGITKVPAEYMIRFKGWTPSDPEIGTSPVETLRLILAEQHSARKYRNQVWKKSGRTGGIIMRPKDAPDWDNVGRRRFLKMWEAFTGNNGEKAGEDVLLEDGMDYKRISLGAKEEQFVESAKLSLETVCQVYHINPTMIGMLDNANYSNVREFRRGLYGDTLGPIIKRIEDRFNAFLLPLIGASGTEYVEFNVEQMLRGSFEEQAGVLSASTGGPWQTRNEARKLFNLKPLPGGDDLIVPLNLGTPDSEAEEEDEVESPAPATTEDTEKAFASVLGPFKDRQNRAVRARKGAGKKDYWDTERWDRELTEDLVEAGMGLKFAEQFAEAYNSKTREQFEEESDDI